MIIQGEQVTCSTHVAQVSIIEMKT